MWSSRPGQSPVFALKADFFRVLGHPDRVRLLQVLRDGERSVGSLQDALVLDSSSTSQHLAALRNQGLVVARKQGTSAYYRIKDPRILDLLELTKQIIATAREDNLALLADLASEEFGPAPDRG